MESSGGGSAGSDTRANQPEKKRPNRVPSPARPSLKDVHGRAAKPALLGPKSPKLSSKQQPPNRGSRRNLAAAKENPPAAARSSAKAGLTKKPTRLPGAELKAAGSPLFAKAKKAKLVPVYPAHGSPLRVPTALVVQTDSSSDLSDCPSELAPVASSDGDGDGDGRSATGSSDREHPRTSGLHPLPEARMSSLVRSGAETKARGTEDELLRDIEDLRSENDYLKDEAEELRAEMEELRDTYMDEEVYQLQELRRELERSNKNCRILQYRLRKAEQKGLRAAQTGHVDGELLRALEQDLKVAKDVSVRLHNELESVEDKRSRAEDDNEELRQRIIEVEISKQALHNELERAKEAALRRRGGSFKDKKSTSQEDCADLRCQLQFAKEESGLMRKKMAKVGREKEQLEQELQKYKSLYGDVDSPLPLTDCPGGGPHSTREAELRLRLKLVEEEANILGRKIVELEVDNRSLRAENDDIRCQYERDCFGREPFSSVPTSPYGADPIESAGELRRHLQFVEEEAELLRRSISEIEDHNRQLTSELDRFRFGCGPADRGGFQPAGGANGGTATEELKSARMQINELSGKVMKLQYENRVLLSNVQRCDLAAHLGLRTGGSQDGDAGRQEAAEDEEAGRLLLLQPKREGPIGGESDSEDVLEKTTTTTTSGLGSTRPSDVADLANRRREERESFANVKREADRLGKCVDRLINDTDSLILEGRLVVTAPEGPQGAGDPQVLDTINTRMKAFRTELHVFVEKLEHVGDGTRDGTDDLSPMPHLTESSSFLSSVTSMSRDSPIATFGRDLMTDFQSGQRDELEWHVGQEGGVEPYNQSRGGAAGLARYSRPLVLRAEAPRESPAFDVQLRLDHERPVRLTTDERDAPVVSLPQEGERPRPRLELPGLLPTPEASWAQERATLLQEVRLFRRNTAVFYAKLKSILARWRHGGGRDGVGIQPELEKSESPPELGGTLQPPEVDGVSPNGQYQHQFGENRRMLQALRSLLEQFREELREEEARRCQLQQAYANDKAAWEVKWAEIKCQLAQAEEEAPGKMRGQAQGDEGDPEWAPKQEREEHRRLLAESHKTSLDLRWRLQHGEKRWSRERAELMDNFERQRQEWDGGHRELHHKMEKLQRELSCRRGEGAEEGPGTRSPRSPRSPRSAAPTLVPPIRSLSDSDAAMAEQVGTRPRSPTESPFLDALSLDPLASLEVSPPCRLEGEKKFPCLKEALNVICEKEGTRDLFDDEEMAGGGSLLRAKSVCSMSDFQRLMDSSPFLPDKTRHGERGQDDVTPPLSPDDLKYIEEFNNKGWDFPSPATSAVPPEGDSFQTPSWFLTTSASLTTTSTLNSRASLGADAYGVHVLRSPARAGPESESDPIYAKGGKARGDGEAAGGSDEAFGGGRWPCGLLEAGGLRTSPNPSSPIVPTVGYASALDLQLSRNMSDDMKEVAISVRNAIRSPAGTTAATTALPSLRDSACQTNGFTTRGTQTTQTISVGLQTDLLRTLTSSPHRCLTPKGGGTPISSPSRNTRKVQYSPVVQSKFERPCCSPKYGSPKLQRKTSSANKADVANAGRAATPTTPQKGNSESAWARSTTTRDSPVHATINDGLSSLFNIIDHTPVAYDSAQKFNKSPSRSRPADVAAAESGVSDPRGARGRSPSPVQLIVETRGERNAEVVSIRQDLSAPPGYTLGENATRILNKKLQDERRLQAGAMGSKLVDPQPGCLEDLSQSLVVPPLDWHFLRPARPPNRRPPSRWANVSPPISASEGRFTFPTPEPPGSVPAGDAGI
ncbi:microtubule cross-linking factor 1 [Stigmatopora nigra]